MLYTTYKNLKKPEETDIYKIADFNDNADILDAIIHAIEVSLGTKAPLASPALTGTPTAPNATAGTSTTQIATTKFVMDAANTKINTNGSNSSIDKLSFITNPSVDALVSGQIRYNPTEETFDFAVNNQVYQLGQEISLLCRNDSGVSISDGQVVAITGSVGSQMTIQLAGTGVAGIAGFTLGIATQNIANGSTGKVTILGLVKGLNTNGLAQGSKIWLGSTLGSLTTIEPTAPTPKVVLGYVKKQHLTDGELLVRINTGSKLDGLDNVFISTPAEGHSIFFDNANQVWKNIAAYTKAQIDTLLGTKQNTLAVGHGDTLNPYASKTAKYFLAAPNAVNGSPTFRAIVASDIPILNQNTTGSAASLTTGRTLTLGSTGKIFNGTANLTWTLAEIGAAAAAHNHAIGDIVSLQTELDGKALTIHIHGISDVTGLQAALDAKQATLTTGYGDTINPYASKTAKYVLAAPNAASGAPSFRELVASDIPTLNQNTTGSAAKLTTGRNINLGGDATGSALFDGSADVTITVTVADDSHNHIIANVDGLQAALDAKQATITGGASSIVSSNLTASRALVSDASGKVAISAITAAQIGYLSNVSSDIQAQINAKLSAVPNANTQLASLGVGTASSGTAGEIRATNNITAYYSDSRLKTFLGKISNPIQRIMQLNGYLFVENEKAKELGYSNDRVQVGVSAQEVQQVLPEAVTEAPINNEYLTVWYDKLVPLLIEGMKAQQLEIDELKKQIRELRGN